MDSESTQDNLQKRSDLFKHTCSTCGNNWKSHSYYSDCGECGILGDLQVNSYLLDRVEGNVHSTSHPEILALVKEVRKNRLGSELEDALRQWVVEAGMPEDLVDETVEDLGEFIDKLLNEYTVAVKEENMGLPNRCQKGMLTFEVERQSDESGVSGTGVVLQGVIFATGKTIVNWLTPAPTGSINIFDSFHMFMGIHVLPHPTNNTIIRFGDGRVINPGDYHLDFNPFS